jgi:hypothetical protein
VHGRQLRQQRTCDGAHGVPAAGEANLVEAGRKRRPRTRPAGASSPHSEIAVSRAGRGGCASGCVETAVRVRLPPAARDRAHGPGGAGWRSPYGIRFGGAVAGGHRELPTAGRPGAAPAGRAWPRARSRRRRMEISVRHTVRRGRRGEPRGIADGGPS